jgi:hypothetical protein
VHWFAGVLQSLCRRHECLRDIEYALDWVSGPARTAFKIFGSKEGRAGLRRYAVPCGAHSPLIRTSIHGLDRGSRSRRPRISSGSQPTCAAKLQRPDSRPPVVIITGRPAQGGGGDGV